MTAVPLVVLVTGASSGIGRACAVRFAGQGAQLILLSRSAEALAAVQLDCARAGAADTLIAVADVGVQEQQFCGTRGAMARPAGHSALKAA